MKALLCKKLKIIISNLALALTDRENDICFRCTILTGYSNNKAHTYQNIPAVYIPQVQLGLYCSKRQKCHLAFSRLTNDESEQDGNVTVMCVSKMKCNLYDNHSHLHAGIALAKYDYENYS